MSRQDQVNFRWKFRFGRQIGKNIANLSYLIERGNPMFNEDLENDLRIFK